jgi:hypothetical protein
MGWWFGSYTSHLGVLGSIPKPNQTKPNQNQNQENGAPPCVKPKTQTQPNPKTQTQNPNPTQPKNQTKPTPTNQPEPGRHPVLKYRVPHGSQEVLICRYGEAPVAAASWRAHDGGRQQRTSCPLLYRYRLTHTCCSLARLPPTHPFVGAPILQRHFQVRWRARLPPPRVLLPHTCT